MKHDQFWRAVVTGIVWLVMGIISVTAMNNSYMFDPSVVAVWAMVLACITTVLLWWRVPSSSLSQKDNKKTTFIGRSEEKAKRGQHQGNSRMALLMELMDEDELQVFKERLKQRILDDAYMMDDGEIAYGGMTMDDLEWLTEDHQRSQFLHR